MLRCVARDASLQRSSSGHVTVLVRARGPGEVVGFGQRVRQRLASDAEARSFSRPPGRSNKELKLTKPALRDGASQLYSSVGPTAGER
jgi:hypothetical protein